jgi:hypothetical protein
LVKRKSSSEFLAQVRRGEALVEDRECGDLRWVVRGQAVGLLGLLLCTPEVTDQPDAHGVDPLQIGVGQMGQVVRAIEQAPADPATVLGGIAAEVAEVLRALEGDMPALNVRRHAFMEIRCATGEHQPRGEEGQRKSRPPRLRHRGQSLPRRREGSSVPSRKFVVYLPETARPPYKGGDGVGASEDLRGAVA